MSTMDPFDEFEFKPLTEGLGFHKKTVSLKEGLKQTGVLDEELQTIPPSIPKSLLDEAPKSGAKKHSFEDVLSALEKTPIKRPSLPIADLDITEPLPREKKQAMEMELPLPVNSPFPAPQAYKKPAPLAPKTSSNASSLTRRGAADSPQAVRLTPASVSFSSAFLDGIIVLALSLCFLIALVLVTKIDLNGVIRNIGKDRMTQLSLGAMFLAVMQMYAIVARSFFGHTLGEWTFDLQVGRDEDQKKEIFPLRVTLRALITTVTGLILLPILSGLFRTDLAGRISGAYLFRRN